MAKIELKFGAISTDDHVQEAPDTWTARMSKARWGDRIPRLFELDDGTETWLMNEEPLGGLAVVASLMPDRRTPPKRWEEVPRAAYVPAERLAAMDADHTDVHTFFPNMAGIARGAFIHRGEPEWRLACIQAYNDWLIEEWADVSPRFVPLCIAPMWDAEAAADEVRRAAALGHRGVIWHGATEALGLPHLQRGVVGPVVGGLRPRPGCRSASTSTGPSSALGEVRPRCGRRSRTRTRSPPTSASSPTSCSAACSSASPAVR